MPQSFDQSMGVRRDDAGPASTALDAAIAKARPQIEAILKPGWRARHPRFQLKSRPNRRSRVAGALSTGTPTCGRKSGDKQSKLMKSHEPCILAALLGLGLA